MYIDIYILWVLYLGVTLSNGQFFNNPTSCRNPNGRAGFCEPIYKCRSLMSVMKRTDLRELDRTFLRASSCISGSIEKGPFVCCTWDTKFTNTRRHEIIFWEPQTTKRSRIFAGSSEQNLTRFGYQNSSHIYEWKTTPSLRVTGATILPSPPTCGGVTITNKILGGTDADLYEFPWMVLLEYNRKSGLTSTHCSGSLINQRYVLTAAHCVTGAIESVIGKLTGVRLGEHDTQHSYAVRIGIQEVIPHADYNSQSNDLSNDIGLIRLQRNVAYTNAIRPVCLPSVVPISEPRAGTQFTVAGWGTTSHSVRATVKQKLQVEMVSLEQCRNKFQERNVEIGQSQLCAGSNLDEDSCEGDSGGPLMRLYGAVWVLDGVVSFGYKCGMEGWPGVYTKVSHFVSWINQNMKH